MQKLFPQSPLPFPLSRVNTGEKARQGKESFSGVALLSGKVGGLSGRSLSASLIPQQGSVQWLIHLYVCLVFG